ncbi:hypothetical protein [Caulobacter phage S2B]|uniref:Uncharacterized protein n=1 Tax=Caulobacter phage S2B TaxID=2759120 RepID=A0AAE7ML51_9CAUD|nr:hypothetical protein [Caulobacter phage S2B]
MITACILLPLFGGFCWFLTWTTTRQPLCG